MASSLQLYAEYFHHALRAQRTKQYRAKHTTSNTQHTRENALKPPLHQQSTSERTRLYQHNMHLTLRTNLSLQTPSSPPQ